MWARDNEITRIELSVTCSNTVAKHLYEKNGFEGDFMIFTTDDNVDLYYEVLGEGIQNLLGLILLNATLNMNDSINANIEKGCELLNLDASD